MSVKRIYLSIHAGGYDDLKKIILSVSNTFKPTLEVDCSTKISFNLVVLSLFRWAFAGSQEMKRAAPTDQALGRASFPVDAGAFAVVEKRFRELFLQPNEQRSAAKIVEGLIAHFPIEKTELLLPYIKQIRSEIQPTIRRKTVPVVVPKFSPRTTARINNLATAWELSFEETLSYLINSHPSVLLGAKVTPAKLAAAAVM